MAYAGRRVYLVALIVGLVYVVATSMSLPPAVPIHFDASGRANGWATPIGHLGILAFVGIVVPLAVVALVSTLSRRAPTFLNLPRRSEWLAPEHRAEADRRIRAYVWWVPVLMLGLALGVHAMILDAQSHTPSHLSVAGFTTVIAAFIGGMLLWVVGWFRVLRFGPSDPTHSAPQRGRA